MRADTDGLPKVIVWEDAGTLTLPDEPWCLASLDQMDRTWKGLTPFLVTGGGWGLRVWEVVEGSMRDAQHTFDLGPHKKLQATQVCSCVIQVRKRCERC